MSQTTNICLRALCIFFCTQFVLTHKHQLKAYSEGTVTEYKTYDCTGYIVELNKEMIRDKIAKEVARKCQEKSAIQLEVLRQEASECLAVFRYHPYKEFMMRDAKCAMAVSTITKKLLEWVFGSSAGCGQAVTLLRITKFYSKPVSLPAINTSKRHHTSIIPVIISILQTKTDFKMRCSQTPYFTYLWAKSDSSDKCLYPEFDQADLELLDRLRISPIRCNLAIFILYGYVKNMKDTIETSLENVKKYLNSFCDDVRRWPFESTHKILYRLSDHLLMRLDTEEVDIEKAHFYFKSIEEILYEMLGKRVQNYFGKRAFYQRTAFTYMHQTSNTGGKRDYFLQCGKTHSVEINQTEENLLVICVEHLETASSYVFDGLKIVSGITRVETDQMQGSEATFIINYSLRPSHSGRPHFCGVYEPGDSGTVWSTGGSCTMIEESDLRARCQCEGAGTFFLLQMEMDETQLHSNFYNPLRSKGDRTAHVLAIVFLSISAIKFFWDCVKHLYPQMDEEAEDENSRVDEERGIRGLLILQCIKVSLYTAKMIFQLTATGLEEFRICQIFGPLWVVFSFANAVVLLAMCTLLLVVRFVSNTETLEFTLCTSTTIILLVSGCIYSTMDTEQYIRLCCLPEDPLGTIALPILVVNCLSFLLLVPYWIFPPYHNWDEWIGAAIDLLWSVIGAGIITNAEIHPNYVRSQYIWHFRLNVCAAFAFAIYHCLFKYGTIGPLVNLILRRPTSGEPFLNKGNLIRQMLPQIRRSSARTRRKAMFNKVVASIGRSLYVKRKARTAPSPDTITIQRRSTVKGIH